MKRLLWAAIIYMFITLHSAASAKEGMGIPADSFFRGLGYAVTKVSRGFPSSALKTDLHRTGNDSMIIEYNKAVILTATETKDRKELKNIAVIYIPAESEPRLHYARGAVPDDSTIFENICKQVMFALDTGINEGDAVRILTSLGLYGPVLDGVQRSQRLNSFSCIMKLQSNGMIIMVVSRI